MHGKVKNVSGNSPLLTETLLKTLVSAAVRKVQLQRELSDQDLADMVSSSASTIGHARNQEGKLQAHTLFNLLNLDEYALEGLLNYFGRRSVPIEAKCDTDELVSTSAAVHKLAVSRASTSKSPLVTDDDECLDMEPEIDAALSALHNLKLRCEAIRLARAA